LVRGRDPLRLVLRRPWRIARGRGPPPLPPARDCGVFVATTPAHVSARAGAERSLSTAYPEHLGINLYWRSIVGGR
jgi:hypothetical protein